MPIDYSKKLNSRTFFPSLEYVYTQDDTPDADGNIAIYDTYQHKERIVPAESVKRVQKYVRGILLDVRFCGRFMDEIKGIWWECWTPIGIALSAWVRIETRGHRPSMIYDPGNHWRKTLDM